VVRRILTRRRRLARLNWLTRKGRVQSTAVTRIESFLGLTRVCRLIEICDKSVGTQFGVDADDEEKGQNEPTGHGIGGEEELMKEKNPAEKARHSPADRGRCHI
jgi:hypothetical protein